MQPETEPQLPPPQPEAPAWPIHGSFILRYDLRHSRSDAIDDERDQDLYQYLSLTGGSAARNAVTASFYGRAVVDLEGGEPGPSLSSVEDTRGSAWDFRLYRAYLAFHRIVADGELRAGRQTLYDTPVLLNLDGVTLDTPAPVFGTDVTWQVYGGVPEHYWEDARSGDLAVGAAATVAPWSNASARLDLMHLEDRYLFGDQTNDLIGARLDQAFRAGRGWVSGSTTWLDGDPRDAGVDGMWTDPELDLQVNARVYSLLTRQSVNTLEFDPFTAVLMDEEPYYEGMLMLSKGFDSSPLGESWRADAGAYGRILRDSAQESEFNHEFQRYWLAGTVEGFPWRAADLTVTGDWWDAGDTVWTLGAELSAELGEDTDFVLASAYSLYDYDFFTQEERTHVRDYSALLRHRFAEALALRLSLSFQEDDAEQYQIATAQLEVSF
ncbi:MAG: hypothetical protein EYC70_00640 [Planctomycetota bacterium]|nr:MAG: hypothetical protein EYC70_00640 [Planctomycetota bacterium]